MKRDFEFKLAEWYARQYFYLGTPNGCVNQCRRVSQGFVDTIRPLVRRRRSIPLPQTVEVTGCRRKFPRRHLWHRRNPKHSRYHIMIIWQGVVIDFTRRQYDPRARFPHYETLEKTRRDWRTVKIERRK